MSLRTHVSFVEFQQSVEEAYTNYAKRKLIDRDDRRVQNKKQYFEAVGEAILKLRDTGFFGSKNKDDKLRRWFKLLEKELQDVRQEIQKSSISNLQDMKGKGSGNLLFAYAIHYRLHAELDRPKYAREIDEKVFGKEYKNEFRKQVFSDQTKRLNLTLDALSHSTFHYTQKAIQTLGREDEKRALERFLESQEVFSWMQIAGAAGQGKSRLAHDLAVHAKSGGWDAGFLGRRARREFMDYWKSWVARSPTLLIVDYVIGEELELQPMIDKLVFGLEGNVPVRLVFIERQRHNQTFATTIDWQAIKDHSELETSSVAQWFSLMCGNDRETMFAVSQSAFHVSIIELCSLNEKSLCEIVRRTAKSPCVHSDAQILKMIDRVDANRSPLFAYFVGTVIRETPQRVDWTREQILREIIDRERVERWAKLFGASKPPAGYDDCAEMRLATAATVLKGINRTDVSALEIDLDFTASAVRKASVLVGAPIGSDEKQGPDFLPALEPDILGEHLVLNALTENADASKLFAELCNHDPVSVVAFIARTVQNFPEHPIVSCILDILFQSSQRRSGIPKGISAIVSSFLRSSVSPPDALLELLYIGLEDENTEAASTLGYCFLTGFGVAKDEEKAVELLQLAADKKLLPAIRNLGLCYENGWGCKQDFDEAFKLYTEASELGDSTSLLDLGRMHEKGRATSKDPEAAYVLYRRAALLGNNSAYESISRLIYQKEISGISISEAVQVFRESFENGSVLSLEYLMALLKSGDLDQEEVDGLLEWLSVKASGGDGRCIVELGVAKLYAGQDASKAFNAFKTATEFNNSRAYYSLGVCYFFGLGVEENRDTAVDMFRIGRAEGDTWANGAMRIIELNSQSDEVFLFDGIVSREDLFTSHELSENEFFQNYQAINREIAQAGSVHVDEFFKGIRPVKARGNNDFLFGISSDPGSLLDFRIPDRPIDHRSLHDFDNFFGAMLNILPLVRTGSGDLRQLKGKDLATMVAASMGIDAILDFQDDEDVLDISSLFGRSIQTVEEAMQFIRVVEIGHGTFLQIQLPYSNNDDWTSLVFLYGFFGIDIADWIERGRIKVV
ncbi:tetratricopeptide repeat protein [Shimia sp. MMG029]|uniref:tetratricopeptide repeat protein n=1 Tax=Shimia sp. MMG029 TaxID=3021978 RepID=UPI0022FF391D|nr:tetratricopeptide repeat protein [Shimia sp. MMG029]MDA5556047.1 tetratricopeptide repeat protein [Shimia sp. MMG029]